MDELNLINDKINLENKFLNSLLKIKANLEKQRNSTEIREKEIIAKKTNSSDDETLYDICFSGEGLDEKVIDEKLDKKTNEKIQEISHKDQKKKYHYPLFVH